MIAMDQYTLTWKLKDLIHDVEEFKELATKYCPEVMAWTAGEALAIFVIIWNRYCNCTVAFDTREDFYRRFYNIIWDQSDYYIDKLKKIREIRKMSNSELIKEYTNISNVANNNNKIVNSPLTDIIPYITTQATSTSTSNLLGAIGRAIREYRNNEVQYFLDEFKILFLDIFGFNVVHYRRGGV